jgi:glycine/D-amino acid oxidase-like deaminating enzyme
MPALLIVGGGLFGSLAAAYARRKGIETKLFDCSLDGAASHAAAGLFKEEWAGTKLGQYYRVAVPLLDQLFGLRQVTLSQEDGTKESFLFVPPTTIMERNPIRQRVSAVGDGWLEAGGERHHGWVYVAAGYWAGDFCAEIHVKGKAGAAFLFPGEREGRIRQLAHSRQAIAFVRDSGSTYFADGTAEENYTAEHERLTLGRAAGLGLAEKPAHRLWGRRPYTKGGPAFLHLNSRTWLATGGRKMGTILGAAFARHLVEQELRS